MCVCTFFGSVSISRETRKHCIYVCVSKKVYLNANGSNFFYEEYERIRTNNLKDSLRSFFGHFQYIFAKLEFKCMFGLKSS